MSDLPDLAEGVDEEAIGPTDRLLSGEVDGGSTSIAKSRKRDEPA